MVEIKQNLKASTLVESLVAMVIITLCLSIAGMVYVNIINSDKQLNKQKANFILNAEAKRIKKENDYVNSKIIYNDWAIEKDISKYEGSENAYQLKLTLLDAESKIIIVRNELFIREK